MGKSVSKPQQGLSKDTSEELQPKGTYRFALNVINEDLDGNFGDLGNEESNDLSVSLPEGSIILGKVKLKDTETALFIYNSVTRKSEIGIFFSNNTYTPFVVADLGFDVKYQIDSTYRLRRGCERVVYFTDGKNKPRFFNFDSPKDFKQDLFTEPSDFNDVDTYWDISKFNLIKTFETIPIISNIEIVESGNLKPGSYIFAIQYLDEDLNPTEFITHSNKVIIYNDRLSSTYGSIRGSTGAKTNYQDFPNTSKAISLTVDFLDTSYAYYRFGIIESTNGSGEISRVVYTDNISINSKNFVYTGDNIAGLTTIEGIQQNRSTIEVADHIEQIENRLILGNTKGKSANLCQLQKYASKIKADVIYKKIQVNSIESKNNQKRGEVLNESIGYQPGEIYSFGIQYIFEDGDLSPVYHIPGKNRKTNSEMSSSNKCISNIYEDRGNCGIEDYWGVDYQGEALKNKQIRHHRFPLRSEVSKELLINNLNEKKRNIFYTLYLDITGLIREDYLDDTINYIVNYTIDGNSYQETRSLDVSTYNNNLYPNGDPRGLIGIEIISSESSNIQVVSIEERDSDNNTITPATGLEYNNTVEEGITNLDNYNYESYIFGINFSNIELPKLDSKEKIIGYYIVRNERTEENKTILDTAILTPLRKTVDDSARIFGQVFPNLETPIQNFKVSNNIFGFLHLNHKFGKKEYTSIDKIILEGGQTIINGGTRNTSFGRIETEDVQPGTSYDPDRHKKRERDSDGFSLLNFYRESFVDYEQAAPYTIYNSKVEDINIFYLNSLFGKNLSDKVEGDIDVYNLSADNSIGIIAFEEDKFDNDYLQSTRPYVALYRNVDNPYNNFEVLPYYRENLKPVLFSQNSAETSSVAIFNGDTFISPLRFTTSSFYNTCFQNLEEKRGLVNYVLGVAGIVGGVAAIIATGGLGTAAGIAAIGFGISQIATGYKRSQINKVFGELYEKEDGIKTGLRDIDTALRVQLDNCGDDTIQWFHEIVEDFWFDSQVNTNWRVGSTVSGLTDFLDPIDTDQNIDLYILDKTTVLDDKANGGRSYQSLAKAEIYEINKDYQTLLKPKVAFHLPREYNCCSECTEEFPHRIHYSEQSFQEELTDNYRTFLPNNYRDIEGETGSITNIFRIQNNLYLHTEEALWHLPQDVQERITGDIISFIGTGSFFSIPPRKVVDSEDNSAGTLHKNGIIKTPYGIFYQDSKNGIIYQFDGNKLEPISSSGMFNWFKQNLSVKNDSEFFTVNGENYPFIDNPSNPLGTGFVSVYDSQKERILITKKDFKITNLPEEDYRLCVRNGVTTLFRDYQQTIEQIEANGLEFIGVENCRLKFKSQEYITKTIEEVEELPNEADVHVFFDISGSFGSFNDLCLQSINDAVNEWEVKFRADNPDWVGVVYKYKTSNERWLQYPEVTNFQYFEKIINGTITTETATPYSGVDLATKDIVIISFCNEAFSLYHENNFTDYLPGGLPEFPYTTSYESDYNNFVNTVHPSYKSFRGIHYPIVVPTGYPNCNQSDTYSKQSKIFRMQSFAAVGEDLSNFDNNGFELEEFFLAVSILSASEYPNLGPTLNNFGWTGKWDRAANADGEVINTRQFYQDIYRLLIGSKKISEVEVNYPTIKYSYIDGETFIPEILNRGWTISYSIKKNSWVSFHSYIPYLYFTANGSFYSCVNNNIYQHAANKGSYQTFYGVKNPYILEYVINDEALITKIYDYLQVNTKVSKYDEETDEFYEEDNITFNKLIAYNKKQSTGELNLIVNNKEATNFLSKQVHNNPNEINITKVESDWFLNELRDYTINKNLPLFKQNIEALQDSYFIDKVVNEDNIDYNKHWSKLESLRDKYLVLRFIFNNFEDVKFLFKFSVEDPKQSFK